VEEGALAITALDQAQHGKGFLALHDLGRPTGDRRRDGAELVYDRLMETRWMRAFLDRAFN
jgi:hypothetical protein